MEDERRRSTEFHTSTREGDHGSRDVHGTFKYNIKYPYIYIHVCTYGIDFLSIL